MATVVAQIDDAIAKFLSEWNLFTVLIGLLLTAVIAHTLYTAQDADIHPMMLLRQSQPDRVRHEGESAVYRAHDVPHGAPLRSGLNVKLAGDKAYTAGRDGDLRSVWLRVTGQIEAPRIPGVAAAAPGKQKLFTVLGKDRPVQHDLQEVSKEIAIIGNYLAKHGSKRIAICLPNSIEFLSALFAASFFGLSVILLPYGQPEDVTIAALQQTNADALIASAGSIALESVTKACHSLRQAVWVVKESSRHMDWTEVPRGLDKNMDVAMWHQVIQDHQGDSNALPELETEKLGRIITIWPSENGSAGSITEFTHGNFVAAIAGLIAAIPTRERVKDSDLILSADSWTNSYALCQTLAGLFSGASLAISSVAGTDIDLTFASKNISPTVVISSSESVSKLHAAGTPGVQGGLAKLSHSLKSNTLAGGNLPAPGGALAALTSASKATIGSTPGTLRLLFVTEKAGTSNPPIGPKDLNDLRLFTGARIVYALTASHVAGAIAQTNMYDYRVERLTSKCSHFGAPVSSVEVKLIDSGSHRTTDQQIQGEIVVYGPAVAGGKANLGIIGTFRPDFTLAYV